MGRIKGSIRFLALSVRVVLATPLNGEWSWVGSPASVSLPSIPSNRSARMALY